MLHSCGRPMLPSTASSLTQVFSRMFQPRPSLSSACGRRSCPEQPATIETTKVNGVAEINALYERREELPEQVTGDRGSDSFVIKALWHMRDLRGCVCWCNSVVR